MELKLAFNKNTLKALARSEMPPSTQEGCLHLLTTKDNGALKQSRRRLSLIDISKARSSFSSHAFPIGGYLLENATVEDAPLDLAIKRWGILGGPNKAAATDKCQFHVLAIDFSYDTILKKLIEPIFLCIPNRFLATWKRNIESSSITKLSRQLQEQATELESKHILVEQTSLANDVKVDQLKKKLEKEEANTMILAISSGRNEKFLNAAQAQNEALKVKALQLLNSAEVTEKAATEFVDQKINEVAVLQHQLAEELAEGERLLSESSGLRELLSKERERANKICQDNLEYKRREREIFCDLKEASDNPSKIIIHMKHLKDQNQILVEKNSRLSIENDHLVFKFHDIKSKVTEKMELLKSILEAGDYFEYLRKWISCTEAKINYYENSYKMRVEDSYKMKASISELQQELHAAKTVAYCSYLTHRTRLLDEKLAAFVSDIPISDYYHLGKTLLNRLSWIFGECESYDLCTSNLEEGSPHWFLDDDPHSFKQMLCSKFYLKDAEASKNWISMPGINVFAPVMQLVPLEDYASLKKDFDSLLEKTKSKGLLMGACLKN